MTAAELGLRQMSMEFANLELVDQTNAPLALRYWGKARPVRQDGPTWHPLSYHSLDVAAVGLALLDADPKLAVRLGKLAGLAPDAARRWLFLSLAMHDLGKFTPAFQRKTNVVADGPALGRSGPDDGHDLDGLVLWRHHLSQQADILDAFCAAGPRSWQRSRQVSSWVESTLCHHGRPRDASGALLADRFPPAQFVVIDNFVRTVIELANGIGEPALAPPSGAPAVSWRVAGLAILCDWIGSGQQWFPYEAPELANGDYFLLACERATRAVREAQIVAAAPAVAVSAADLLPPAAVPTPLQTFADEVLVGADPQLFILEDQTGAGKTEAALALAGRMIVAGAADGLFVALPTMATANAMYGRCVALYRRLFAAGADPTITLAHSRRDLVLRQVSPGGRDEPDYGDGTETGSAACASWLADDRRKASLADCGVGTVDQAVMAVLPNRFQALRLVGLARKVLVVDEVHAHDPYLRSLLCRLLTFHAAQGGSVILLSATLPALQRRQYAAAFALGRGHYIENAPGDDAYPLLTRCDGEAVDERPVPPRPGLGRHLAVRFLATPEEAADLVAAAAAEGQRACWIRNSVADAREGYAMVGDRVPDAMLFHARFAMGDRLDIEGAVLARFAAGQPPGAGVLVATQVVEQSLDLDFDVMVSDLAPIDSLIQRAGRLWRRPRPDRMGAPVLHVLGPEPVDAPDAAWMRRALPRAALVYPDHAALWLTARLLDREGGLRLPDQARLAVEYVFGEEPGEAVPDSLMEFRLRTEGQDLADAAAANAGALDPAEGYAEQAGNWPDDHRVPTRLGEAQSQLRLARWDGARLTPWYPGDDWRAWRLSEVTVLRRHLAEEAPADPPLAAAIAAAKVGWPKWDESLLVTLTEGGGGAWTGTGLDDGGRRVDVRYDRRGGLVILRV